MTAETQHTLLSNTLGTAAVATGPAFAGTPIAPSAPGPDLANARDVENVERALIDQSARGPVLTFFSTGIFWLLVAVVLGYMTSKKLHVPGYIPGPEFLYHWLGVHKYIAAFWEPFTYGRLLPAYNIALIYGWCSLVGMGVATWLIGRLTRVAMQAPGILQFGAWFWNVGVAAGVVTVLCGYNSGLEYFEMHRAARACMFIGYLLIGIWGLILFRYKRTPAPYITVSYLVAAWFLFPWFFGTTDALTHMAMNGVMKNVVNAWYQGALFNLWLGCLGLGAAYYFIPKIIDRPIYSYNLAKIGFWSWIFLGGLTAMTKLSGGPVPAYLITISVAASILLIVPIATVMTNFARTMHGQTGKMAYSPTLRFVYVGTVFFAIAASLQVISALRSVSSYLLLTTFAQGQMHAMVIGFFSMVMFGSIYYITPRLVGCEWLSRTFIRIHFLGTAYGGGIIIALLLIGGIETGFTLNSPLNDSVNIPIDGKPFFVHYNLASNFGGYMLLVPYLGYGLFGIAQLTFAIHFLFMRLRIGQPAGEPTLLATPGEAH
jgi:cytochrome c oxidase cbb3-type subunit 1